jgi:hypothetical protein
MHLNYLDFDVSDEESGRASFDAMASVLPERLPPLLAEIATVLRWAIATFGPGVSLEDEGDWDFDVQGTIEPDIPLKVAYDASTGEVTLTPAAGSARTTLTLTLSGSPAFCEAFRARFELSE